ncbi:pre-mRNA-splicing factor SYF2 [Gaeumannomyces tritici R3-111a-1]|uniref:Pre-mRNA-splicing factor SYF2 n=1 Tax=Gaeumannomyces tritici (strain R3-111a-1) TaxID=644352 RepID=J3P935_GAET3|nr:pre-mRNA-splicing factor SYF2 [Gaeumannomyces tritici R3-111a-1]EJT73170.1 pre-mRNA-splicing factor SYF2 [Gaeumannomyces tritici R3-111a-1]
MPPAKKRRTTRSSKAVVEEEPVAVKAPTPDETAVTDEPMNTDEPAKPSDEATAAIPEEPSAPAATGSRSEDPAPAAEASAEAEAEADTQSAAEKAADRMARFRALQERAKKSSDQNLKAATAESRRLATDPTQLTALHRRHAIASHKILKADVEDAGGDFERKRAWDWTVEESEQWDKRMKKKESARDNNAFQDFRQEAQKIYKRQLKNMPPDLERYASDKMAAINKAAAAGTLDIVETEDGELIAVDRDGSFYSTADSTSFANNRPDKAAIDRLVNDMKKAEDVAAKKRKARTAKNGDDDDVTYINDKNKQFNQKLSRFYNKYTAEIRESFERGTMI